MNHRDKARIAFFDRIATTWDRDCDTETISAILHEQLRAWPLPSSGIFLDIGCGTGLLTRVLVPFLDKIARVVAIDYSSEMLRQAQHTSNDPRVSFLRADACSLPIEKGSVDCILVYSALPHFDRIDRAVAEFAQVLKPHGCLHIWHTQSRARTDAIHARVDPAVGSDILPPVAELSAMANALSLTVNGTRDDDTGYELHAVKQVQILSE